VQVQLHNECCEVMDTRMNLSKLSLNLNLKQTFSHAEDMKYAGIKIKELEKNISEQECRENTRFCTMGTLLFCIFYRNNIFVCYYSLQTVVNVKGDLPKSGECAQTSFCQQGGPCDRGSGLCG
jgi:hypothetical protein